MVLLTCPKDELFKPSNEHEKISEKSEIKAVKASDLRRAGFPFLLAGGSSMSDVVVPRISYKLTICLKFLVENVAYFKV